MRLTAQSQPIYGDGSGYGTDLDQMVSASEYVNHVGGVMSSEVNNLFSAIEAHLSPSTWQGPAAAAFHRAQAEWHEKQQKLVSALNEIAEGLGSSHRMYNQAE